jgi:protein-L-isoaspartate(D-aspartate) O-methyltransferase
MSNQPSSSPSSIRLNRVRGLVIGALALGVWAVVPTRAQTARPTPPAPPPPAAQSTPFKLSDLPHPPIDSSAKFVAYLQQARKEDPKMLAQRFSMAEEMIARKDVAGEKELRAYLLTPREEFVREANRARSYESAFLAIGYGVTISGPHLVGRMTSTLDVQPTDRVLEVGTGSGYQSAVLSHLTDQVYTIEIIEPLAQRTAATYQKLIQAGYREFTNIRTKIADGYFGWPDAAPFDKIIVTCGIDHIPPPLLQQLKTGGIMTIPVGPPGRQHVLEVRKVADATGKVTVTRRDIYDGKIVNFVPFTRGGGGG